MDASVQDAEEALAGAQAQHEELDSELEPLRSELEELETKIEDATASGDTDAPLRECLRRGS